VVVDSVFYILAGVRHFIKAHALFEDHTALHSSHAAMVRVSGAFEILGRFGLLVPATRRAAVWPLGRC
jgi:uncharacterized membrane protein